MDFGIIYQLKAKKYWWVDVVFYFAVTLFMAAVICYFLFSIKIKYLYQDLEQIRSEIGKIGTAEQKQYESDVFKYQSKIEDFASILAKHKNTTNLFKLIESITLSNVWFSSLNLDASGANAVVNGEADNKTALNRQIAALEENEFIKSVSNVNSVISETGRLKFNLSLSLDTKIFSLNAADMLGSVSPSNSSVFNQ